jgi:hypothetical protein
VTEMGCYIQTLHRMLDLGLWIAASIASTKTGLGLLGSFCRSLQRGLPRCRHRVAGTLCAVEPLPQTAGCRFGLGFGTPIMLTL